MGRTTFVCCPGRPDLRTALRVSPMGIMPQQDRRSRVIVDYSFHGVNDDTICLGPNKAMQFAKALERLLYTKL